MFHAFNRGFTHVIVNVVMFELPSRDDVTGAVEGEAKTAAFGGPKLSEFMVWRWKMRIRRRRT